MTDNKKEEIVEEEILEEEITDTPEEIKTVKYDTPTPVEEEVDVADDGRKFSDLSPMEKIKVASTSFGVTLKEPNSSCRRCHGLGYVSMKSVWTSADDGEKINEEITNPCRCIFHKDDKQKMFTGMLSLGRAGARKQDQKDFHNGIMNPKYSIQTSASYLAHKKEQQRRRDKARNKRKAKNKMSKNSRRKNR